MKQKEAFIRFVRIVGEAKEQTHPNTRRDLHQTHKPTPEHGPIFSFLCFYTPFLFCLFLGI